MMRPLLLDLFGQALQGVSSARRWAAFWGPVADVPALLGPVIAIGSVLVLALLSGIAVAALATLVLALLFLYLLLTEVFGVTVDVAVPG